MLRRTIPQIIDAGSDLLKSALVTALAFLFGLRGAQLFGERSFQVKRLGNEVGNKARWEPFPHEPSDLPATYADVSDLECPIGLMLEGERLFVEWCRVYRSAAAANELKAVA